jgi:hypothetical protein
MSHWMMRVLALVAAAAVWAPPARAAEFCVDSVAELESALASAALTGGGDAIRVVQGTYTVDHDIDYLPLFLGGTLSITGGYLGDCSSGVQSKDASATRFVSSGAHEFRIQKLADNGWSEFMFLRFDNFDQVRFAMESCSIGNSILRLFNVRVDGGGSASRDALALYNPCGLTRGYNLLVHDSVADGVSAVGNSTDDTIDLVNLTSVDNGGRGLKVIRVGSGVTRLTNSIVHGNGTDLFGNAGSFAVESSIYASSGGAATVSGSNNLAVDPELDANFYPIAPGSPAIDSGTGAGPIGLANFDLAGGSRINGLKVDRGAYELGSAPGSILSVINSNDSGAGSLRDALADAEAAPGRQVIRFAIPGACPRVIALSSPLPTLTGLVTIDGYSQPGARANDSLLGFNAITCVVLAANPVSVPYALRFASSGEGGSEVRGLAFSAFQGTDGTAAAIQVASGADHRILGNQFGGSVAGLGLTANRQAIHVDDGASRVVIGGDIEARNLISASIDAGVMITADEGEVQVRGNRCRLKTMNSETSRRSPAPAQECRNKRESTHACVQAWRAITP